MLRRHSPVSIRPASTTSRRWQACKTCVRRAFCALGVVCLVDGPAPAAPDASACRAGTRPMARTELYFGGDPGDAAAWRRFVATVVTPRFPTGLTLLEGRGQWREPRGLLREATHILVIFHPADAANDARLDAIRTAYKTRFRQHSVLLADMPACVGF